MPLLCALWLALLLIVAPGRARAQEPLRILVLEGPTAEWLRRVRGQLSDLPVSISTLALVVEGQPEPELARQLGPLAEHRDAALVAWLATERLDARGAVLPGSAASGTPSTQVAVWFARTGRFFSRPLGGPWSRLSASDRSGVLELAALSVRSAVRSLLLDPTQSQPFALEPARPSAGAPPAGTASAGSPPTSSAPPGAVPGTPAARAAVSGSAAASPTLAGAPANPAPASAAAASAAAPSSELPAASESASSAETAARAVAQAGQLQGSPPHDSAQPQDGPIVVPRGALPAPTDQASAEAGAHGLGLDLHWNAELGVVGQLPGPPAYGAAGFELGVRARQDDWGVLVLAQLGLPVRAKVGPSDVQVLQHALLAEAQYLRWNTGAWSFGPVLRAGLRLARRETVAGDPGLAASTVKWLPGLRLGLGWATELRLSESFGATLRGVLHWDPVHPNFEVQTPQHDPVASAQAWAVQPSLELSGNWYW